MSRFQDDMIHTLGQRVDFILESCRQQGCCCCYIAVGGCIKESSGKVSEEHLKKHYSDLKGKPFFGGLVSFMASGPLVAMVWEGLDVVKQGRSMLGETNPLASKPGSIRGDYSIDMGRNICHGSDSVDSAKKEIALWFQDKEVCDYKKATDCWVYE